MALHLSLSFNGNCREALDFYSKVFEVPMPEIMCYDACPPDPNFEMSDDVKNLIMYTSINIMGVDVMLSDNPPGMEYSYGKNIGLAIVTKDADELKKYYEALKEDGTVEMELCKTFWSDLYGIVTDKFGVQWQFNLDIEDCEGANQESFKIITKKLDDIPVMYISKALTMENLNEIGPTFDELTTYIAQNGGEITGSFILYGESTEEIMNVGCCLSVKDLIEESSYIKAKIVPGGEFLAAQAIHKGSYEELPKTWKEFMIWIEGEGYTFDNLPMREIYLNSPMEIPENELLTEILIPVKKV